MPRSSARRYGRKARTGPAAGPGMMGLCNGSWGETMAGDTNSETGPAIPDLLSGLRLDELLREVQDRLAEIMATRDRMQGTAGRLPRRRHRVGARHHPATPGRSRRQPCSGPVRGARCARRARRPVPVPLRGHRRGNARGDGPSPRGQGSAGTAHRRPASVAAGRPEHARGLDRLSAEPPADAQLPRRAGARAGRGVREPVSHREGGRWRVHPRRRGRRRGARRRGGHRRAERGPVRTDPSAPTVAGGDRRDPHRVAGGGE